MNLGFESDYPWHFALLDISLFLIHINSHPSFMMFKFKMQNIWTHHIQVNLMFKVNIYYLDMLEKSLVIRVWSSLISDHYSLAFYVKRWNQNWGSFLPLYFHFYYHIHDLTVLTTRYSGGKDIPHFKMTFKYTFVNGCHFECHKWCMIMLD